MPHPNPAPDDVHECAEGLRSALRENGITLPSLGVELPSFAGSYPPPLVALGNCNTATARKLAEVLRKAAAR
ncbi:hypothetical protein GCM10010211_31490 [Streptomyces albospinus]|uniref:Secreted protein n=1 Tax=Streptomyces albospinus TaxID=285515 RepID=A0ABQ2V181_9ACTN|nr:hypothetical protein [Streptomyces albospinus]GGU64071.1 hypothetical protein GCM10010211_31490 [Streptomyces albospinus]